MLQSFVSVLTIGVLWLADEKLIHVTVPPDGKAAESRLINVVESERTTAEYRADAMRNLAIVGTKQAVPALAMWLYDERTSHMARYALEPIPDPSVDDALREALGKAKGKVRIGLMSSIGVRRDAKAVPLLAKLLSDADAEVAGAAARALGSIGTAEAAKALQSALDNVAPENNVLLLNLCEGILRAAEHLAAAGDQKSARALYDRLLKVPKLPRHVRTAAMQGLVSLSGEKQ